VDPVSIIRVGLAETKNFSEGYEAIFGTKKKPAKKATEAKAAKKTKKKKAKKS
jgi:ribosomal protein L9